MTASSVSLSFAEFVSTVQSAPFKQGGYTLLPLRLRFIADFITPVAIFLRLNAASSNSSSSPSSSFLFESVVSNRFQHRFSYCGVCPTDLLVQSHCDPLIEIEKRLRRLRSFPLDGLPDFSGGFVGYVAYDCASEWEKAIPRSSQSSPLPISIPDSIMMLFHTLVVIDHISHSVEIICNVECNGDETTDELRKRYDAAVETLRNVRRTIRTHVEDPWDAEVKDTLPQLDTLHPIVSQSEYESFVVRLQEECCSGSIIQAVPSQRAYRDLRRCKPFDVYRHLRIINPSPYMFYMHLNTSDPITLVGASPEQLLKIDSSGRITTHPIAGTRKRGKNREEDEALAVELLGSEKERAEHVMLVDLGRNDVGRIAAAGTVKVDRYMKIEKFSHVQHIVSEVSGILDTKKHTIFDAFRSIFPAGTVSGAPKIKAMQLIAELENNVRGVYGGAVGYFTFSGTVDTAIAIRTIVCKGQRAFLQSGGGIVFDSTPFDEWMETQNKMRATEVAIEVAEKMKDAPLM